MSECDFSLLSEEQQQALNDEQKAIYQMLSDIDRKFFAQTFATKDLPKALERKGEILKRNQAQHERLNTLKERLSLVENIYPRTEGLTPTALSIGGIAVAALGIGAVAQNISTDGSANWKGVSPRLVANALERSFDNNSTTDTEVEGTEDKLIVTIYLRPPNDSAYVPALSVFLFQIQEKLQVTVSDLTSDSVLATAKQSGKKLFDLAVKGFLFWQRRHGIFASDAVNLAKTALNTAFDATQMVRDLDLEDRVWQIIKETADAREKAYLVEAERLNLVRQDLETAWDDYYKCPRCGESMRDDLNYCRICGRARNAPPSLPDPRISST